MTTPIRVLIVEDSEDDAELLLRALRRGGYEPDYERVETPEAMKTALEQPWDAIVSDWTMPHFSAEAALGVLRESGVDLPFIIVSGTVGEEAAVAAMLAGAHDYMAKGRMPRLIPAIQREMREATGRAERRTIERQLRHTQKMEAMGQLTGGIAHDFNNLLGVIVANADLLLDSVEGNVQQVELVNGILTSALHGAALTHRLLAFARQQPLSSEIIALNEHLPRIITILTRTLGETIAITTLSGADLWKTRVDPSQIEDALLNLAINARDAMPGGGMLTIETANAPLDEHYAELHPDVVVGDYVMLSITDSGTGMPPEIVERVLEPFFTTKESGKGTGLGLSMVYGFAKQSGGHLSIYSELGFGTTVRLYLPRAHGEAAPEVAQEPAATLSTTGKMILLVDDNEPLRRVTLRQLIALGYTVEEAKDGPTALALLDAGKRFDLLFTDIGLPGGLNGYELAEQARQRQPGLKVLFTTGYGANGGPNIKEGAPAVHLIRKPYRSDELGVKLRAALADNDVSSSTR